MPKRATGPRFSCHRASLIAGDAPSFLNGSLSRPEQAGTEGWTPHSARCKTERCHSQEHQLQWAGFLSFKPGIEVSEHRA